MKNYLVFLTLLLLNSTVKSQCNGTEPIIDLGNDTVLCVGQSLTLSVAPGYDYYNWTNGSFQTSTVVSANGTYAVTAGILGQNLVLNGNFQGGGYIPDSTYTMSLSFKQAGIARYGFQITSISFLFVIDKLKFFYNDNLFCFCVAIL